MTDILKTDGPIICWNSIEYTTLKDKLREQTKLQGFDLKFHGDVGGMKYQVTVSLVSWTAPMPKDKTASRTMHCAVHVFTVTDAAALMKEFLRKKSPYKV